MAPLTFLAAASGAQPAPSSAASSGRPAGTALTSIAPLAPIALSEFAQRRALLAAPLPDGIIVALGAREPREDYVAFFQAPAFHYVTGVKEPDAAMIGIKTAGTVSWTLFVQPREPAREVWTGARVGPEQATSRWGLPGRSARDFTRVLDSLLAGTPTLAVLGDISASTASGTADEQFLSALQSKHPGLRVQLLAAAVTRQRGSKSAAELDRITRAAAITVGAHREAARAVQPNAFEYEVQADLERAFRRQGADRPAFASIVGSGPNGTTLHYNANTRQMQRGEMVVIDIGASYDGYAADMTRAYPVSGTFSPAQRAIYQVVRDAQAAAERQARAGMPTRRMSDSASAVLAAGLTALGLIDGPDATYDCGDDGTRQCRQLTLFYMHGLSHGIGLDVHDPDQYSYDERVIGVGSVFTIEPGLYIRGDAFDVLPKTARNAQLAQRRAAVLARYRNIGVRIEDDYLVTESGLAWLTKSPREIAEIELLMKRPRM